mmetsp:Transcript_14927/g.41277  ORF Transcript_14927/g.41277 Transcript_14927/m.41277 type:complete len:206 (+) Transcript_14927:239-856(+)|eukprot:CAMPEP_0168730040 /NCGR_PEP_ID=MMETSP0724-20121128/6530_1 /TAXON_ID=265536 /ORGANISM="Amphiprora sp., Strain CCMP467" /LENGTH=205 /DNA_ID=CAMNT_0008776975 /DNA_START=239 /DNA_END=856 /DNA_ORIENTATION=-
MAAQKSSTTTKKAAVKRATAASPRKPTKKTKGSSSSFETKKNAIFRYMCEQHAMQITEMDKRDIGLAVGNENTRSEGFHKPFKQLQADGLIATTTAGGKDTFGLTDEGIQKIPKDLTTTKGDPTTKRNRYIEFVEKRVKMGKDKVRPLWGILKDGKSHTVKDISNQLGYTNPRSFGNTKMITILKDMKLVEDAGKGAVQFTAKAK